VHLAPCPNVLRSHAHSLPLLLPSAESTCKPASLAANTARRQMTQCREAYWNCLQSTCYGSIDEIYASLNGALGLDDVELLSRKQSRLTGELFCEWRACLPESVSFGACYLTVCSITCYLLMVDYVSVSLFCISVPSAYFAHLVAHFTSSHVV